MYYQNYSYGDPTPPSANTMSVNDLKLMTASRLGSNAQSTGMLPQIQVHPRGLQMSGSQSQTNISQRSMQAQAQSNGVRPKSQSAKIGEPLNIAALSVQDIKELTRQRLAREQAEKRAQEVAFATGAPILEKKEAIEALPSSRLATQSPRYPVPGLGDLSVPVSARSNPSPNRVRFDSNVTHVPPPQSGQFSSRPTSRPETLSPNTAVSPPSFNNGLAGPSELPTRTTGSASFNSNELRLGRALTLLDNSNSSPIATSGLPQPTSGQQTVTQARTPLFTSRNVVQSPLATVGEDSITVPVTLAENPSRPNRLLHHLPDVKQLFGFNKESAKEKLPSPILTASGETSIHSTKSKGGKDGHTLTSANLRLVQFANGPFEHSKGVNLFMAPQVFRSDSKSSGFSSASGSLSPLERNGPGQFIAKDVAESVLESVSFTPRSASSNFEDSNSNIAISRGVVRNDSCSTGF